LVREFLINRGIKGSLTRFWTESLSEAKEY